VRPEQLWERPKFLSLPRRPSARRTGARHPHLSGGPVPQTPWDLPHSATGTPLEPSAVTCARFARTFGDEWMGGWVSDNHPLIHPSNHPLWLRPQAALRSKLRHYPRRLPAAPRRKILGVRGQSPRGCHAQALLGRAVAGADSVTMLQSPESPGLECGLQAVSWIGGVTARIRAKARSPNGHPREMGFPQQELHSSAIIVPARAVPMTPRTVRKTEQAHAITPPPMQGRLGQENQGRGWARADGWAVLPAVRFAKAPILCQVSGARDWSSIEMRKGLVRRSSPMVVGSPWPG